MSGVDADVVAWRRHLHRHPEVSFEEHETSAFVAETLEGFGAVGRTPDTDERARRGWAAAAAPRSRCAPTSTRSRSTRTSGVEFASERPGAMHACGHDGHTAMLLGAARELPRRELRRRGPAHLPARRGDRARRRARPRRRGRDGRRRLRLRLPPVDAARGRQGRRGAGPDHGRRRLLHDRRSRARAGTPGCPTPRRTRSRPPRSSSAASSTSSSRRIDPLEPAVVTIGSFHAGDAPNVIPGRGRAGRHRALVRRRRARAHPGADRGDRPRRVRGARRRLRARLSRSATRPWSTRRAPPGLVRVGDRRRRARRARSDHGRRRLLGLPRRGSRAATRSSAPAASTRTTTRASGSTSARSPIGTRLHVDVADEPSRCTHEALLDQRRRRGPRRPSTGALTRRAGPTRRRAPCPSTVSGSVRRASSRRTGATAMTGVRRRRRSTASTQWHGPTACTSSPRATALPLLLLHGWPSSVWEFHRIDPAAARRLARRRAVAARLRLVRGPPRRHRRDGRGAARADGAPSATTRYLVAGGDWGASIAARLAHAYPDAVEALHLYMLPLRRPATWPATELASRASLEHWSAGGGRLRAHPGHASPQTLAYGLKTRPSA